MPGIDLNVPSGGARSASIEIDFGAGELHVDGGLSDAEKLAVGVLEHLEDQQPPKVEVAGGDSARLHISQGPVTWNTGMFGKRLNVNWDIHLSPAIPTELVVKTGASAVKLDLEQMKMTTLDVKAGASDTSVVLPASGVVTATIEGGAAQFTLEVPRSMEARIVSRSGLASVSIDPRFERQGDAYVSAGYATAANRLDMSIQVGVASVNVTSR
jgi:hypothetical protein